MNIFQSKGVKPFVSDITLTPNQNKYLVDNVLDQLDKFYYGNDSRRIVLNAFTGSGKTTVSIKSLIPEFIKKFYPEKRVIAFMAPRKEVVGAAHRKAKAALDKTTVNGAKIRVYDQTTISALQAVIAKGQGDENDGLEGDVIVIFITAQYFNNNFDFFMDTGIIDLMIVDEAHIMFGTINAEDTLADKGQTLKDFVAKTYDKLALLTNTAILFLTATPTNSQQMFTNLGIQHIVYLDPMPRDVLTTPFYDVIPYLDNEDTCFKSIDHFHEQCIKISELIDNIEPNTWEEAEDNLFPMYPAMMLRLGRRGAINGLDQDLYLDRIRNVCKKYNFRFFVSTNDLKEFDGYRVADMDEGIVLGSKKHDRPIVMVVVEAGTAGLDFIKINSVGIARDPSSTIHNGYSQTAGRAARMKFGFVNHALAADTIRNYNISDEQKRLLAQYYIEHSSSTVHVPVDSKLLNGDVKDFIETDTYRKVDGEFFILNSIFKGNTTPKLHLSTYTSIQDNSYKKFKKKYCEVCSVASDGNTHCFHATWNGFAKLLGCKITKEEMDIIWPLCLQVHHIDGNHFNNDPKNLSTICPNVHAAVTIKNEDYNNRYAELREALRAIARKNNVPEPKMLAFCV